MRVGAARVTALLWQPPELQSLPSTGRPTHVALVCCAEQSAGCDTMANGALSVCSCVAARSALLPFPMMGAPPLT